MIDDFERAKQHFLQGLQDYAAGRMPEAERAFEASLALLPGRASTLVNLGATKLQLAKPQEALDALDQALASTPADVDAWCHRCEALARLARYDEALVSCDKAIAIDDRSQPAWQARARLLTQLRRYDEAVIALERLTALLPTQGENWLHRGQLLQKLGRHDEALRAYDQALALNRGLAQAWSLRGGILKDRNRVDEAAECFRQAIAHGGDAQLNNYFLASLVGGDAPASAPTHYVQALFDDYADTFDTHLVEVLNYEAHRFLIENLHWVGPSHYGAALDLGCGTGLCGPLVKPMVQRLYGVDLSGRMLDKARALGVYDALEQRDLVEHLRSASASYDLVLAADVFAYVGELESVFAGVRGVMNRGGIFCFSVEQARDEHTFVLNAHQRYAHSERYVRELAQRHGFETAKVLTHAIREDQRAPIPGLYFYLRR